MYKPNIERYSFGLVPLESDTALTVADGKVGFVVSQEMDGCYLNRLVACITGTQLGAGVLVTQIQIRKLKVSDGLSVDLLSTKLSIDPGERSSLTAGTDYVINSANAQVSEGDVLFVDRDQIPDITAPEGLSVTATIVP